MIGRLLRVYTCACAVMPAVVRERGTVEPKFTPKIKAFLAIG